jgi:hypothetical protein
MKSIRRITPAALTVLALCFMANSSFAGITGSKHDFGQFGWAKNQICLPCHTPHNAIVRDAQGVLVGGPLWNHTLSTATYTLYVDPDTGQNVTGQVDTNSRLCLSCHDGTVALDSFGGGAGTQQMTGTGLLGTPRSSWTRRCVPPRASCRSATSRTGARSSAARAATSRTTARTPPACSGSRTTARRRRWMGERSPAARCA